MISSTLDFPALEIRFFELTSVAQEDFRLGLHTRGRCSFYLFIRQGAAAKF